MSQPNPATCLCSSTQSFHWLLEWNSQPLAVHLLCISCHFVIGHMQCNHAENSLKPLWLYRANSGPSHGPWTAQGNVRSGIGWALIAFMDLYGIYDIYGILWHLWPFMAPKCSQLRGCEWWWRTFADVNCPSIFSIFPASLASACDSTNAIAVAQSSRSSTR